MKYCSVILTVFVLLLGFHGESMAHKVNVFAYADGDAVQVECYFTRSQKVRHGKLTVTDLSTGEKLFEATTDEQGLFRFQPDTAFLKTGHGMNILLSAGEGHQSDWEISAEELASLSPSGQSTGPQSPTQGVSEAQPSQATSVSGTLVAPATEAAELEALIGKVMDAKLAPIKQSLAWQQDNSPNLRDIIGGIGWIIGLLGLATYMKYRR
jgi:nickel transport protein